LVENTRLISPISGIVTARNYDKGDMYAGQPVLVIAQITPVKIMINVSEPLFSKVKKGMPVFITLDAYGDEVFKGKIARVYPTINQATHTFQVEVTIPNYNERVRPGMFARVTLPYGKANNVVVPDRAVQKLMGSGDRYVFVYNPADSTVRYSKVELGRRLDNEYEIYSGVKSGEMLVTKGHMGITNGSKVELVK
jgi:RND family efflux transporter MFP subunit